MARTSEREGLSPRALRMILGCIVAAFVGLLVIKAIVPGFLVAEGRRDVVAIGHPLDFKNVGSQETITMTVTDLQLVSAEQRAQWDLRPASLVQGKDVYLVHFTVSDAEREVSISYTDWRLLDTDEAVHQASPIGTPPEARCETFEGPEGEGCAVIVVPQGTTITMVQYYGLALGRKQATGEVWAGWTP
jgi:hypothetical protein